MKLIILFFSILFSISSLAIDNTGGYAPKSNKIKEKISDNNFFSLAYGLLRRAHQLKKDSLSKAAFTKAIDEVWKAIKLKKYDDIEEIYDAINTVANNYWPNLASAQYEIVKRINTEQYSGGFTSKDTKIKNLVRQNKYFAFSFSLLQQAYAVKNKLFIHDADILWKNIKKNNSSNLERIQDLIREIANKYWYDLNEEQQRIVIAIMPMKRYTGGYTAKKLEIRHLVHMNNYFALSYGLLRRSYELDKEELQQKADKIWMAIIKFEYSSSNNDWDLEKIIKQIKRVTIEYRDDLNSEQQKIIDDLVNSESLKTNNKIH